MDNWEELVGVIPGTFVHRLHGIDQRFLYYRLGKAGLVTKAKYPRLYVNRFIDDSVTEKLSQRIERFRKSGKDLILHEIYYTFPQNTSLGKNHYERASLTIDGLEFRWYFSNEWKTNSSWAHNMRRRRKREMPLPENWQRHLKARGEYHETDPSSNG